MRDIPRRGSDRISPETDSSPTTGRRSDSLLELHRKSPAVALLFFVAILLSTATCRSQSTFTGGSMSFTATDTSAVSSTATVSGATGTVKTVSVELDGVKSAGTCNTQGTFCYFSLQWAEFMLKAPNGTEFVLLASTGDGADGCDGNPSQTSPCNGLQGTLPGNPNPDTITITDGASTYAPYDVAWFTSNMPYTVKPSSYYYGNGAGAPPLPGGDQVGDFPQTDGCSNNQSLPPCSAQTMNAAFNGATADGTWTLYLIDNDSAYGNPDPVSISGWKLTLTYNSGGAASTSTSISSSANPITYLNSASSAVVTFTATVSSSGGTPTGTVTFTNSTSNTTLCSGVAMSGGIATCTTSLTQGVNTISAAYSGSSGTFGTSSDSMVELVEVTPANPSGDQWCNNQPVSVVGSDAASQAYPSVIKTSGYPGGKLVSDVQVELNGVVVPGSDEGAGSYLLVGPGGTYNLDFLEAGFAYVGSSSTVNLTFSDSASGEVSASGTPSSGTYLPTDHLSDVGSDTYPGPLSTVIYTLDSSIPQIPGTLNYAPPYGTGNTYYTHTNVLSFGQAFNGAPANGAWALYAAGPAVVRLNSGWCITLSLASGNGTITTLTSGSNPATSGQALTFSATVTSGGNPVTSGGTVTFLDNNATPAGTVGGNNVVNLNGSGLATFTTSSLSEGDHTITATYSGTSSDNESFSSALHQRINNTTTATNPSSDTWQYCNAGPVEIQQGSPFGPLTPNPSVISVANLPGTLNTVSLTLNNFFVSNADNLDQLASLVEGPTPQGSTTGPALDFFSNTTQGSNGTSEASSGSYVFEDSAASPVPSGNVSLTPTQYKPTAYESFLNSPDVFTSSASGFYPAPTAGNFSYAAPTSLGADSTFADVFTNGSDANGNWELFFSSGNANGTYGAAGGWCLNFTENLPVLAITKSHSQTFTQGDTGDTYSIEVKNNGPGPTGGTVTVTEVPPTGLTVTGMSGNNWSCSSLTCTRSDQLAESSTYYPITVTVNVSASAAANVTNSATVSGGGSAATQTANDPTAIVPIPTSITLDTGNNQAPTVGTGFSSLLSATIKDAGGAAIPNLSVTFTAPSSGASSTFLASGNSTTSVSTDTNGIATASVLTANDIAGAYSINISAGSITNRFSETNQPGAPASITATSGTTPQVTTVNTSFAMPLSVTVADAFGNPIPGASVTFTAASSSGASGTFSNSTSTITASTNGSGIVSEAFTANGTDGGPYSVTAVAGSLLTTFSLSNVIANYLWIGNMAGTTSAFIATGVPYLSSAETTGGTGVAIDSAGNVWSLNAGGTTLSEFGSTGTPTSTNIAGGGLNTGTSLAIDGLNQVWITNSDGSIAVFNSGGTPVSSTAYNVGTSAPTGIAIDISGNLWIANSGNSSVTKVLGGAAPTVPLAKGVSNGQSATEP